MSKLSREISDELDTRRRFNSELVHKQLLAIDVKYAIDLAKLNSKPTPSCNANNIFVHDTTIISTGCQGVLLRDAMKSNLFGGFSFYSRRHSDEGVKENIASPSQPASSKGPTTANKKKKNSKSKK